MFVIENAIWMHWWSKMNNNGCVGVENIERKRKKFIYAFVLQPVGGFGFVYAVHNGLTSIPWWLPTYFSLLPAMNFNELVLPLPNFCHVGIFLLSNTTFLDRTILACAPHVLCWLQQRKEEEPPDKTVELRASQPNSWDVLDAAGRRGPLVNAPVQDVSQLLGACNNNDIIFILNYR